MMGYQAKLSLEEAQLRDERVADAELFQADPDFARSVGIDLSPLQVACYLRGLPAPPALHPDPDHWLNEPPVLFHEEVRS